MQRSGSNHERSGHCFIKDSPTPTHTSFGSHTTIVEHLKTSQFRCSNRPSLTAIQQNSPHSNATRDLQIRAITSSVTLQSELIELPRYVKRSTTSSASPWIVSGVFSDWMSRSMTLHFVGTKCNQRRDDFVQFIQKHLRLLRLFEDENDVVRIFQIDKVFIRGHLNAVFWKTVRRLHSHLRTMRPGGYPDQKLGDAWENICLKWLEREFTDARSVVRFPLSKLGQPGSIPALVIPSGGMAARHRKGVTAEGSPYDPRPTSSRGRDGSSGKSANLLTGRSVVRTRPLPLEFPCLGLGNLEVSQPSCNLRLAWQLGTERVLQLNDFFPSKQRRLCNRHGSSHVRPVSKLHTVFQDRNPKRFSSPLRGL
ncbi:hypothetical protein CSKR_105278 [Clonorchis sinensis]|uniref:Uncharacterized protein n=1 Tax=Clonorchis sinensis TaxID=79923 RepID=A0A3R7ER72_CLOSI|nr:hypothetical protein CSKR_105278 [Clonorchis sinensis]